MADFKRNLKWYLVVLLLGVTAMIWQAVLAQNDRNLKVAFLDIGQGDAIFIESPTGKQVLIDAGPPGKLMNALSTVMPYYDHLIDLIILTHPDQDHIAGFVDLLQNFKIGAVLESGVTSSTKVYQTVEGIIKDKEIPDYKARRGTVVDLGGGAHIDILFPDQDVSNKETNEASIVARLVYGDNSVLLQGDSPQIIEKYLIKLDKISPFSSLKSDILKAGHHGSKTSTSSEYVDIVSPYYAIISAGKDNKYGHPDQEILKTLKDKDVQILRTDELGTIIFTSDGRDFTYKTTK